MKKIIFVVGHENWGKSRTLKALTNNNTHIKNYSANGNDWFIRRMSNDDKPDGYYKFMDNLKHSYLIAAFCPNFDKKRKDETVALLNNLKRKNYDLHFWVLKKQFNSQNEIVPDYIKILETFGKIYIYPKNEEADIRSCNLKKTIRKLSTP